MGHVKCSLNRGTIYGTNVSLQGCSQGLGLGQPIVMPQLLLFLRGHTISWIIV